MGGREMKTGMFLHLAVGAAMLAAVVLFAGCPHPLESKLFKSVRETVDAAGPEPDILLTCGGSEIKDGGTSDAFIDAVEGVAFDVVYTIENGGDADLHLRENDTILFSGDHAGLFSILSPPGNLIVAPGNQTSFTIRLELDSSGDINANIALYSDDPDENPYEFTVSNTALPEIQILQDSELLLHSTGTYDFNTIEYGDWMDVEFTIQNVGNAELDLVGPSPVTVSGDGFSIQSSQPSTPVAPQGGSATFVVRLHPTSPGVYTAEVNIDSNDTDENPYTIHLTGECVLSIQERKLSANYDDTLAVRSNGTVWAWGAHKLGNDPHHYCTSPYPVEVLENIAAVSAGGQHSVVLTQNGEVWAWGSNTAGQLGDGTNDYSEVPVRVLGLTEAVSIAAGDQHSLALRSDGTVWAWGSDYRGQIGNGSDTSNQSSPVQVVGMSDVVAIAAGSNHCLAVKTDGTVWTWGYGENGQLGNGTTPITQSTPVQATGLNGAIAVSAGEEHSAALGSNGVVWTWGSNASGQLGDGTGSDSTVPIEVTGVSDVQSIAAGRTHMVVSTETYEVWSWGKNDTGQLGDGTVVERLSPVHIAGLPDIEGVTAGGDHSTVYGVDGTVWSWGWNENGQLGNGTCDQHLTPVQVRGIVGFKGLAAGDYHTLAYKHDGSLWSWGGNTDCQLGTGSDGDTTSPGQIDTLDGIVDVGAFDYNSAAVKSDGSVWCWGDNEYGQLGIGEVYDSYDQCVPVQVNEISAAESVTVGASFALALLSNGTVWGWGKNGLGQLGDGTNDQRASPVVVEGISDFTAVEAGANHALAIRADQTVWAWGHNSNGQLGDGTTDGRNTPAAVAGLTNIIAVSAGTSHSVALDTSGKVWTWGDNWYGQLGDATNDDNGIPIQVPGVSNIVAIAAGEFSTFAVHSSGTVYAWGSNGDGQLGNGGTVNQNAPVEVALSAPVEAVAAGWHHSIAVKKDSSVSAWGENYWGQLGNDSNDGSSTPVACGLPFTLW
jgi:alpha-tubulin suppressor-like RCC1 family protein